MRNSARRLSIILLFVLIIFCLSNYTGATNTSKDDNFVTTSKTGIIASNTKYEAMSHVKDKGNKYNVHNLKNGDIYIGNYRDNLFDGKGTLKYKNGDIYEGDFKKGVRCGKGEYKWINNERYRGQWSEDKINGYGIYFFNNGDRYEGDWLNNVMTGEGKYTFKNGKILIGYWENNNYIGIISSAYAVEKEVFTLGSTKAEVKKIMGKPDYEYYYMNTYDYGYSSIYFDENNKVCGWDNESKNLKVSLGEIDTKAKSITIGSTKIDVVNAMGTPDKICQYLNEWNYNYSQIYFDDNNQVSGWDNTSKNLKVSLGEIDTKAKSITIGSSKTHVIKVMGTPDRISRYSNEWDYNYSEIYFNENNQVCGWNNTLKNLRVSLGEIDTKAKLITKGSTKADVVNAMGTPDIISQYSNKWDYEYSSIYFDEFDRVSYWYNISKNLKVDN